MTENRRNQTLQGQRQRVNESFSSPRPELVRNSYTISDELENLDPDTTNSTPSTTTSSMTTSTSSTLSKTLPKNKKQEAKPNVLGNLVNPDDYLICPLASKVVENSCHFKGYIRDNNLLFSAIYVNIVSNGKSILEPLREHIILLKKVILYMLCYFFDTVFMIEKVSN
jgi:hypothetical protein